MAGKTFAQKITDAETNVTSAKFAAGTAGQKNAQRASITMLENALTALPAEDRQYYAARVHALRAIVGLSKDKASGNASSVDAILAADWTGLSVESLRAKKAWATMAAGTLSPGDPRRQMLLNKIAGITRAPDTATDAA